MTFRPYRVSFEEDFSNKEVFLTMEESHLDSFGSGLDLDGFIIDLVQPQAHVPIPRDRCNTPMSMEVASSALCIVASEPSTIWINHAFGPRLFLFSKSGHRHIFYFFAILKVEAIFFRSVIIVKTTTPLPSLILVVGQYSPLGFHTIIDSGFPYENDISDFF